MLRAVNEQYSIAESSNTPILQKASENLNFQVFEPNS